MSRLSPKSDILAVLSAQTKTFRAAKSRWIIRFDERNAYKTYTIYRIISLVYHEWQLWNSSRCRCCIDSPYHRRLVSRNLINPWHLYPPCPLQWARILIQWCIRKVKNESTLKTLKWIIYIYIYYVGIASTLYPHLLECRIIYSLPPLVDDLQCL